MICWLSRPVGLRFLAQRDPGLPLPAQGRLPVCMTANARSLLQVSNVPVIPIP